MPPLAALWVQSIFWQVIQPYVWFLFYPAIFLSALIGGRVASAAATLFSVVAVWWFFIPPAQHWTKAPGALLTPGVFVFMGMLFTYFGGRLRAANQQARHAADQTRELVAQAPDGVFVADLDGRYTDVNEAGCRLLGYRRDEVIGKTILDLIPPGEAGKLEASRAKLLAGKSDVGEWRLRRSDGTWVPVEVSAKILSDGRWQGFVRDISERKAFERKLIEREADLNRAQTVAQIGSWRLDVRRNELTWSPQNYRIFGVAQGTAMSYDAFLARVHPDDRAYVDRTWKAALEGEAYDIEHRILVDRQVRWVREKADLEFDDGGQVIGGIGITQDVTALKQAQDQLEKAHVTEQVLRRELQEIMEAGSAISEAVAKLPKSDMNAVFQSIVLQAQTLVDAEFAAFGVGANPNEPLDPWLTVGASPQVIAPVDGRYFPRGILRTRSCHGAAVRIADATAEIKGDPHVHAELKSFMGLRICYQERAVGNLYLANKRGGASFTEQDERLVRMLADRAGVAIEIATVYGNEAVQRARLQAIIEQMPEAVVTIDERGVVVMQNHAAKLLRADTGRRFEGGSPVPFDVRYANGAIVEVKDLPLVKALSQGGNVVGAELTIVAPGGQHVPVLVSASAVRIDEKIVGAVGVFQDIRELKELERMREEWASIIAHDLRQPVGVIGIAAEMIPVLHAGEISDKELKAVGRIKHASARMNRMISDLLDASRLEAKRLSIQAKRTDLRLLAEDTILHLREATEGRRIEVVGPRSVIGYCDPDRIEQVLANLISNAIKYGAATPPVRVELFQGLNYVEVAVTNHGAGIPAEDMPLLFSRFSRTPHAAAGKVPGLGLGLYISHGLIEAHGGLMWAESIPGKTTTFHFTVPRNALALATEELDRGPRPEGSAEPDRSQAH